MYELVMGIDMGHGEVAAHYLTTNGIVPCTLDPDTKDKTLFSAIGYTGNTVKIGKVALSCDSCYAYFKASPREWNNIMPGGDGKKTRKQLMEDYLRQLMKQIRDLNPELTELLKQRQGKPGKVLLLVGCPTSLDWLGEKNRKEYESLISRATGNVLSDVRVVPESRAAIFSVFSMNKETVIDTTKGIAVFDFGSSTTDFTYLQMGIQRVEHSWTLGAARIEEYLTQLSFELARIDTAQLSTNGMSRLPLAVRSDKEAYFNDGSDKLSAQSIDKVKRVDGREERIPLGPNPFTGKPLYDHVTVNVPINDQTISFSIMGEDYAGANFDSKFCVRKDGVDDWESASWYEHCRNFFNAMKQDLKAKGLPCETVVLTGGASKMAFVQQLWRDTFKDAKNMICEKVPSFSVSIGLCYLANAEAHLSEEMNSMTQQLRIDIKDEIVGEVTQVCDKIAQHAYKKAYDTIQNLPGEKYSVCDLSQKISSAFINDSKIETTIHEHLVDNLVQEVRDDQKDFAKQVLLSVFPGLEGMVDVSFETEFAGMLKEIGIDGNRVLKDLDLTGPLRKITAFLASMIFNFVTTLIVYVVLCAIPVIGPLIALIAGVYISDKVSDAILEHGNHKVKTKTLLKKLASEEASIKANIRSQVKTEITNMLQQPKCMGEDYTIYLDKIVASSCQLVRILSMQEFK